MSKSVRLSSQFMDKVAVVAVKGRAGAHKKSLTALVRAFCRNVPPEDVSDRAVEDMAAATASLYDFAQTRKKKSPKIRVFNPDAKKDGWSSTKTVLQVINDDMPFLVDSMAAYINRQELGFHLVIHPIVWVKRDAQGKLQHISDDAADGYERESFVHIEIAPLTTALLLKNIETGIEDVLHHVRVSVDDWQKMCESARHIIDDLQKNPPPVKKDDLDETIAFLQSMLDNHFTFLGVRDYIYHKSGKKVEVKRQMKGALGLLKSDEMSTFSRKGQRGMQPMEVLKFIESDSLISIDKSSQRSPVHRPVYMDVVRVKKYDKAGKVVGETRFSGLFTSLAYSVSPRRIPILRQKIDYVLKRADFLPSSHDSKALTHILDMFPRNELFQISNKKLFETAMGILHLQDRPRTAIFVRYDDFERFVSCIIYTPREVFTSALREKFSEILTRSFNGRLSAFYTELSDSMMARIHFIIGTEPGNVPDYNQATLEQEIIDAAQSWRDQLQTLLIDTHGEENGLHYLEQYKEAFPASYQTMFDAWRALLDIEQIENTVTQQHLGIALYQKKNTQQGSHLELKIYNHGATIPLSNMLPVLENMGLNVINSIPMEIKPSDLEMPVWLYTFEIENMVACPVNIEDVRAQFQDGFLQVWQGHAENDGFNKIILAQGLSWRETSLLRAYAKYLKQVGFAFSQNYIENTLVRNPQITGLLTNLFQARFDPAFKGSREKISADFHQKVLKELDAVTNLDEDRIIRRYLNLITSTLRTNYFQNKDYISFKFDSTKLDQLPEPRPLREVFVYSPRVEAIHLRGGKVARGGIRWSDRPEDFRAEVLGLMKAQMVKNAVIVPVGSKGGFVVKKLPQDRSAQMAEVIACYQTLMRGLLDITDNLSGDKVIHPENVVRYDDADPYLVVAADKGTASFSDIANGVSAEYGFWLGDAFASGGSAGYDHKAMGITAKGGWESVKRHFRETGMDIQKNDFTVVGVGDMAGDVFGNGMLLSKHIQLVAAFNHMHIFVDPAPDVKTSFKERERLFKTPRSTWMDYDKKLISKGGGVFDRHAKTIAVSPEMQKLFELPGAIATPDELIKAILKAQVDLVWFGGIGTFVKSSNETHGDVSDRFNDAVRINGAELRCKVVGEGANLGVTQRGRIEFAGKGGRINTDAIDNSAGVDCSDHEVNIKILLSDVMNGHKMSVSDRNKLLAQMTDDVGQLVLRDNYLQTQALTLAENQSVALLGQQVSLMKRLEKEKKLRRDIEFLPDDEEIQRRRSAERGFTRPEMAVLLAYSKIDLYNQLLASDIPDEEKLVDDLVGYFPKALQGTYRKEIARHRLKREIIATILSNNLINRMGCHFVDYMRQKTGMKSTDIVRAFTAARTIFALDELWEAVEKIDLKVPALVQTKMMLSINGLAERVTLWFLRHESHPLDITKTHEKFADGIEKIMANIEKILPKENLRGVAEKIDHLVGQGVPGDVAKRQVYFMQLDTACDIAGIAIAQKCSVVEAAKIYYMVGARFSMEWLRQQLVTIPAETSWERDALHVMEDVIQANQQVVTRQILSHYGRTEKSVDQWIKDRGGMVEQVDDLMSQLRMSLNVNLPMVTAAVGQMRLLIGS